MEVIAKVTSIKPAERKISISIKEYEPIDPEVDEIEEAAEAPAEE